jgi:hypothetical protein
MPKPVTKTRLVLTGISTDLGAISNTLTEDAR